MRKGEYLNMFKCANPMLVKYTYFNGKVSLVWQQNEVIRLEHLFGIKLPEMEVKCGKCLVCTRARANEWAVRAALESKAHKTNCFLTLTYSNNYLFDNNLVKRDYQLFIKRLRRYLDYHNYDSKIKYTVAGEYGDKGGRKHFHIIIFGWMPNDLEYKFTSGENRLFTSNIIQRLWPFGISSVGVDVNLKTTRYLVKYMNKFKVKVPIWKQPEFFHCSNGIGLLSFDPESFSLGYIYLDGKRFHIPRYFKKKYDAAGMSDIVDGYNRFVMNEARKNPRSKVDIIRDKLNYLKFCKRNDIDYEHLYMIGTGLRKKFFDNLSINTIEYYLGLYDKQLLSLGLFEKSHHDVIIHT